MVRPPDAETTRVTITLPTVLVRDLDERLVRGESSRDAAIMRLIEAALHEIDARERRRAEAIAEREQWVRAWHEQPDTEEEFGWTTSPRALGHLADIPWRSGAAPSGGQTSHIPGDDRSS